jgi:hypothetical protein
LEGVVALIALIVLLVIAIGVIAVVIARRRKSPQLTAPPVATQPAPSRPGPAPMTDLEAALANVTDRSGRPLQEHIDAESNHVDDLRVPNDTGPLLRRALDSVASHDDHEAPVAGDDPSDTGDDESDDA